MPAKVPPSDLDIAHCFNATFCASHGVEMRGGAAEPCYAPARQGMHAQLRYREDFAASALHEAAHWCIAGQSRLLLEDFGYIYLAPPRTPAVQQRFFEFELKTQTLEALFAAACGLPFTPSADNLAAQVAAFGRRIRDNKPALECWLATAAGARAALLRRNLRALR